MSDLPVSLVQNLDPVHVGPVSYHQATPPLDGISLREEELGFMASIYPDFRTLIAGWRGVQMSVILQQPGKGP